jgi:hypothetical protein
MGLYIDLVLLNPADFVRGYFHLSLAGHALVNLIQRFEEHFSYCNLYEYASGSLAHDER